MSGDRKKARARAVRNALLEGSEKLGDTNDYGHGLANIYGSYKRLNGKRPPKSRFSYVGWAVILCVSLVIVFFLLRLKDRNTQREYFETYIPAESANAQQEIQKPAKASSQDPFGQIVFLIRSMEYKEALSAIDDALKAEARPSSTEAEILSLYKMIILYETGSETKARALANSLRPAVSQEMRDWLAFYTAMFKK